MTLTRVWWVIGYILVALAVTVCLLPGDDIPRAFEINDKVSHGLGHAVLAMWFAGLVPRHSWWKIFVCLLMLGIAVEFAQYFMHVGRSADWRDVIANSTGALSGLLIARLGVSRWPELASRLLGRRRVAQ